MSLFIYLGIYFRGQLYGYLYFRHSNFSTCTKSWPRCTQFYCFGRSYSLPFEFFMGIAHFALYILMLEVWSIYGFRATDDDKWLNSEHEPSPTLLVCNNSLEVCCSLAGSEGPSGSLSHWSQSTVPRRIATIPFRWYKGEIWFRVIAILFPLAPRMRSSARTYPRQALFPMKRNLITSQSEWEKGWVSW